MDREYRTKDHKAFRVHASIPFRLFDKGEMAKLLSVTTRTIDRMIASRTIPHLRLPTGSGKTTKVRFDSRDIEKWIETFQVDTVYSAQLRARLRGMMEDDQ